ncbi:MAG: hypothetical protein WB780_24670 [Candidatus Acidiferrales bacterium]
MTRPGKLASMAVVPAASLEFTPVMAIVPLANCPTPVIHSTISNRSY